MALKRQKNNIVNLALMVVTADEKAGMSIDQTILNGKSATVSVRLLNGGRKSAALKLDRAALTDLQEALTEILATDGDFQSPALKGCYVTLQPHKTEKDRNVDFIIIPLLIAYITEHLAVSYDWSVFYDQDISHMARTRITTRTKKATVNRSWAKTKARG